MSTYLINKIKSADGRDRLVILAAASAIVAKGGGLALQVFALPVVLRLIGVERFGVFSLVSSVLGFLSFAQFGIGGHLTQQIAVLRPINDKERIRGLTSTALVVVGCASLLICLVAGALAHVAGLSWLWGDAYLQHPEVLRWGFYCVLIIGWCTLVGNTLAGCQAGYQELHVGNLYGGAGNLLAAISLIIIASSPMANERGFWLALYGAPLLVVALNVSHLLYRHPELRFRPGSVSVKLVPSLFRTGGGFMIVQTMLPLVQREGSRIALAKQGNIVEVAHLSVFLLLSTIIGGLLVIFTQPLLGAVADAVGRNDMNWVSMRLGQVRKLCIAIGALTCCTAYFAGPGLLHVWLGGDMNFTRYECLFYALYFSVSASVHVNHVFMLAQKMLRAAVLASVAEICLLVGILTFACPSSAGRLLVTMGLVQLFTSLPLTCGALAAKR